jgi:hypothetical protein
MGECHDRNHDTEVRALAPEQLEHVTSGFLMQEATAGLKLIDEMRSNVSKTRSEITMTFALNLR